MYRCVSVCVHVCMCLCVFVNEGREAEGESNLWSPLVEVCNLESCGIITQECSSYCDF